MRDSLDNIDVDLIRYKNRNLILGRAVGYYATGVTIAGGNGNIINMITRVTQKSLLKSCLINFRSLITNHT
jgi:hypothetical protein